MTAVDELTAGAITLGPGTLYRSLQRMRVDGLVEEIDVGPGPEDDRRAERRRSYRITSAGQAAARAEAARLARLFAAAQARGLVEGSNNDQPGVPRADTAAHGRRREGRDALVRRGVRRR
jgi:DNA-binding PadR family transcriptional regulator